ncbi:MAG TPA: class I SAM-dependent methyltransferase [Polyangiaceae bacterium]|nr:class I SAM-dependent methyltransferase [Polyangiaceae bacterium]
MNENAEQIEYWNGPAGGRWAREQDAIDRAFEPFTARLLERVDLRQGAHVLDVGCGCGATTLAAADAVGAAGSVVGVDVSVPMVARARERSAGRANVAYIRADAAVHVFPPSFDAAISRFGVMFFRRPLLAFARLGEALRPGAALGFVCWRAADENEWVRIPAGVLDPFVPADPVLAADEPGPFAFADASRVASILGGAGYTNVAIEPFDADVVLSIEGLPEAVRFVMATGPAARRLRDADDDTRARVGAALAERLRAYAGDCRVALRGAVWIVTAIRPRSARRSVDVRLS